MGFPVPADLSCYGLTVNAALLVSVPLGVVTLTNPLVAPFGTDATIALLASTRNGASVPLNVTAVLPLRLFPMMATRVPTVPDAGLVSTNRGRFMVRRKSVP